MDSHKMHVQSSNIFSQLWSIPCCSIQKTQQLHGGEREFCWTPPFSIGVKERLAVCSLIRSFQNLGVTCLRGMCVLVGGVCFQHMVKWRAMNVLWRKGKEQWGVLISSWQRWVFYSRWNACSWPGTEGTAFSYTGVGDSGIWKWVKEIHVWAYARWFCYLYFWCGFLPMFGLSSALLLITLQGLLILVGIQREWDWCLHKEQQSLAVCSY